MASDSSKKKGLNKMQSGKGVAGGRNITQGASVSIVEPLNRLGSLQEDLSSRSIQEKSGAIQRIVIGEDSVALKEKVFVLKQRYVELGDKVSRLKEKQKQLSTEVLDPHEERVKSITERLEKLRVERLQIKELLTEMDELLSLYQQLSQNENDLLRSRERLSDFRTASENLRGQEGIADEDFASIKDGLEIIRAKKLNIEEQLEKSLEQYESKIAEG